MACPSDPEYAPKSNFRLSMNTTLTDGSYGSAAQAFTAGTVHPDCMNTLSYIYTGWMITKDSEAIGGLAAYTWMDEAMPVTQFSPDGWRDKNSGLASFGFSGSGNAGGSSINRLSSG